MSRSRRKRWGSAAAALRNDGVNVLREPMIAFLPAAPFLAAAAFRFALPAVAAAAERYFGFSADRWYWLVGAFLLQFPPMFYGMIAGFMLLEEREERILQAISVTPLGKVRFLAIRLGAAAFLSFAASLLMLPMVGIPRPAMVTLVLPAAASGLLAPIYALLMAGFAENRIEGLAVGKLLGLINLIPLGVFLPPPYRAAVWPLAPYWITRAVRAAAGVGPGETGLAAAAWLSVVSVVLALAAASGLAALFRRKLE